MIIHKDFQNLKLANPVVTLGVFDGVHRGHRALLEHLVSRAKEIGGEAVVITFSPHPRIVLEQDKNSLSFLTTMEEKMLHLKNANVDHLVIIKFDKKFSKIPACNFVKDVMIEKIGAKHLIIGFNHHFGKSGEGDFNTIKGCAKSLNFKIEQVQGLHIEEGAISSSIIREALLNGKLEEANRWLGYAYSISGIIVEGRKIGRSLGFPTANIVPDSEFKLIPANGVYAVDVILDAVRHSGILSIGSNPTVNNDPSNRSIEVNILNFDKNIYGKGISVIFRYRLRDEIKFDNTGQLSDQMKIDRQQATRLLT
jgi:riboflavin kinase / FMN adenylyltransferase